MIDNTSVSLRDIIGMIISFVRYLFSNWLIIGIVVLIGGILGVIYAVVKEPTYSAKLNFVLATNAPAGGGLMGLASQFGVNLDDGNDNVFAGDNIITLMKSRRMVQQALFLKPVNSKETLLNILIKDNKLDEGWKKNPNTENIYPFPNDPAKMSLSQDSIFRNIYAGVQNDMLLVEKPENSRNLYEVTTTSANDTFAFYFTKYLVASTSTFYIETKTRLARQNLDMLQREADSIRQVLGGAITSAGSQADYTYNLNPAYQVQRSGVLQSQARATALGQAYAQVLSNLEIAKITLQKETPLYQIIDEPTMPLVLDKPSKKTSAIIGGFLGGLLACFVLLAKMVVRSFKTI